MKIKQILINLFLDYNKNYIDVLNFAAEYDLTEAEANIILTAGRNLNELENRKIKTNG